MKQFLRCRTPFRQLARLYSNLLLTDERLSALEDSASAIGDALARSATHQAVATQLLVTEIRKSYRRRPELSAEENGEIAKWLQQYAAPAEDLLVTDPQCYVNWLGLQTTADMFAGREQLKGTIVAQLPVVDDGVYGGNAEYTSLLRAIEATPERNKFTAVELGAGWGPWISAVGVVCKRLGFTDIQLVGVEAHDVKCEMMREHLLRNRLMNVDGVRSTVLYGAAWKEDGVLRFPKIDMKDHGGAATESDGTVDYRGNVVEHVSVPALSIQTICKELGPIDYMHWDIQGAELETARASIDFLERNVRYLFVGTHSRAIEGHLLELFYERQWDILLQTPCQFVYDRGRRSLEAMTRTDGEIFLRNPHFGVAGQRELPAARRTERAA